MRTTILTTLFALFMTIAGANTKINFHQGSFEAALSQAAEQHKLIFVDFYASWCAPCQWMDKTTFKDEEVISRLNKNYIPVKVNIDEFDGFELKERYDINVLPTVLIFDESGKLIERVEETLSPSKMKNILDQNLSHKKTIVHNNNTSPSKTIKSGISKIIPPNSSDSPRHYELQLAVFTDYARTLKYYNQISPVLDRPMVILHGYKGNQITYRVLVSNIESKEEAQAIQEMLKNKLSIDSFIKTS